MRGSNSTVQGHNSKTESSGLSTGLTERADFDANAGGPYSDASLNESGSKAPGFTRQAKGKRGSKSASKYGSSFEIEGCK